MKLELQPPRPSLSGKWGGPRRGYVRRPGVEWTCACGTVIAPPGRKCKACGTWRKATKPPTV